MQFSFSHLAPPILYSVAGGLAGIVLVWLVGSSLEEISVNPVFSIVFGIILVLLALMLLFRVRTTRLDRTSKCTVIGGAVLVASSGVASILLDHDLVSGLSHAAKIPMYSVLALSLSFAFVYLVMDLLLLGACRCAEGDDEGYFAGISSYYQVYTTVGGSLLIGLAYGLIFGFLDLETDTERHRRWRRWCLLLGFLGGFLVSLLNLKFMRDDEAEWEGLGDRRDDAYDEAEERGFLRSGENADGDQDVEELMGMELDLV